MAKAGDTRGSRTALCYDSNSFQTFKSLFFFVFALSLHKHTNETRDSSSRFFFFFFNLFLIFMHLKLHMMNVCICCIFRVLNTCTFSFIHVLLSIFALCTVQSFVGRASINSLTMVRILLKNTDPAIGEYIVM